MSAVGAIISSVLIIFIIFGTRRWATIGFVAGILYLTQGESLNILGFNLYAHRFLELAGILRVGLRGEFSVKNLNRIDKIFLGLIVYTLAVFALRSSEGLTYQIGNAVDAVFSYFTFRGLIHNTDDFNWTLSKLVFLLIPYIGIVCIERITGQNYFSIVGASPWVTNFREGIPRCSGTFRHAILLGSFGASLFPLYIGLFFNNKYKTIALIGVLGSLGIVFLSNSGGPLSALVIGIAGWVLWRFKKEMRLIRRGMFLCLIILTLFMKAPIWALPFKISKITGGGGWHRYYLIEMAIENFNDWWMAGMPIEKTINWFPYMLEATGGADITNQFISFGITAGIIAVILLIILLINCFKIIGITVKISESDDIPSSDSYLAWGIGVMIAVHISNWFGVTYFDQMKFVWYMHLAVVAMLHSTIKAKAPVPNLCINAGLNP